MYKSRDKTRTPLFDSMWYVHISSSLTNVASLLMSAHIWQRDERRLFSVNVYPDASYLVNAYLDMLRHLNWKSFCVIYGNERGEIWVSIMYAWFMYRTHQLHQYKSKCRDSSINVTQQFRRDRGSWRVIFKNNVFFRSEVYLFTGVSKPPGRQWHHCADIDENLPSSPTVLGSLATIVGIQECPLLGIIFTFLVVCLSLFVGPSKLPCKNSDRWNLISSRVNTIVSSLTKSAFSYGYSGLEECRKVQTISLMAILCYRNVSQFITTLSGGVICYSYKQMFIMLSFSWVS